MKTIFEISRPGKSAEFLPELLPKGQKLSELIPPEFLSSALPELPELSESEVVRHYTRLSRLNFSLDTHFYPLGSCTMKYNPRVNELLADLPEFTQAHPYLGENQVQGCLGLMAELESYLCRITGMEGFSFQPSAGAQGELTALLMISAYLKQKGQERKIILVPDSSHGTNPASARMAGFSIKQIKSNREGNVDLEELKANLNPEVAALMLTNPNTLGLFEKEVLELSALLHEAGALLYYDGANLNALMGIARPGDMGFDLLHLNLHKTFATPHGGGGPGAGPVGAKGELLDFLPFPRVKNTPEGYRFFKPANSIGKVKAFYGNFQVLLKAFCYIRALGAEGLKEASQSCVLSANFLKEKLKASFLLPYPGTCMHEFVLSAQNLKQYGIRALDIAKALLDYNFHPPTIYFPLIVPEALMIEPTETESFETLEAFADALKEIAELAKKDPESLKNAPLKTPVLRVDEVAAARMLCLKD